MNLLLLTLHHLPLLSLLPLSMYTYIYLYICMYVPRCKLIIQGPFQFIVSYRNSFIKKLYTLLSSCQPFRKGGKIKQTETQRSISKLASDAAPKDNWMEIIREMLEFEKEDEDAYQTRVCILKVQKHLKSMKPEAYIPQFIGLGPYHHWDDDLQEMERYKVMATSERLKKHQKDYKEKEDMMMIMGGHNKAEVLDFQHDVVGKLIEEHCRIRACYDKNLHHLDDDKLAWMMAIDAVFLLEFLLSFSKKHRSVFRRSPRMAYLVNPNQSAYHFILRDLMTLENQIPMFVLPKVISGFSSSSQAFPSPAVTNAGGVVDHHHDMTAAQDHYDDYSNQLLELMLIKVCKKVSPLRIKSDIQAAHTQREHLLDLLYYLIVPPDSGPDFAQAQQMADPSSAIYNRPEVNNREFDIELQAEGTISIPANPVGPADESVGCSNMKRPPFNISTPKVLSIRLVGVVLKSKPVRVISDLAARIINNPAIGGNSWLSGAGKFTKEFIERENPALTKSPLVEEITIPSVSQLHEVGINFCPAQEPGIHNIKFDKVRREFHLPRVRINEYSEVVLRNLVAYEASAVPGPNLILARYTELMNGIIDDAKDVALLRKSRVIKNRMKSDDEVAALWNGMSKSIRLTNVSRIDRAIEEVNNFYFRSPKVKVWINARNFVNGSWKCLMVLSTFLLVALMALQSFCEVYSCPRLFFDLEKYSPTK